MSVFKKYAGIFSNMISNGNLISIDKMASDEIKPVFNKLVTSNNITQVYCVTSVGLESDVIKLKKAFIVKMNELFKGKALTETFDYTCRLDEDFSGKTFRKRVTMSMKKLEDYEEVWSSLSRSEKHRGKLVRFGNNQRIRLTEDIMEMQRIKTKSFSELLEKLDEGHQWGFNYLFIIMRTKDKSICDDYLTSITNLADSMGTTIMQIQTNLSEWIKNYTFLNSVSDNDTLMNINANIMSDKQMAFNFNTAIHGGNTGINNFLGFNYYNKDPYFFNLIDKDEAKNMLILFKTGEGKTVVTKTLLLFFARNNIHANIMDYKGGEYEVLSEYLPTKVIDFNGENPRSVDTLELIHDTDKFTLEQLLYFKRSSINATIDRIKLLVGLEGGEGNFKDVNDLITTAINNMYRLDYNVKLTNPKTYHKSKGISYEDLLQNIQKVIKFKSNSKKQVELLNTVVSRLSPYFLESGTYNYLLSNPVTLSEVLETPMVVFNFNKNTEAGEDMGLIDELRITSMSFLSNLKTYYRKCEGLYTATVYEELQRGKNSLPIAKTLNHDTTGGRSSNKIIITIANSTSFLDVNNNPKVKEHITAVRSSYTSYLIGRLNDNDIEFLEKNMNLGRMMHYIQVLNKIENKKKMDRCFAFRHRGEDLLIDFNLERGYGIGIIDEPLYVSADTYEA